LSQGRRNACVGSDRSPLKSRPLDPRLSRNTKRSAPSYGFAFVWFWFSVFPRSWRRGSACAPALGGGAIVGGPVGRRFRRPYACKMLSDSGRSRRPSGKSGFGALLDKDLRTSPRSARVRSLGPLIGIRRQDHGEAAIRAGVPRLRGRAELLGALRASSAGAAFKVTGERAESPTSTIVQHHRDARRNNPTAGPRSTGASPTTPTGSAQDHRGDGSTASAMSLTPPAGVRLAGSRAQRRAGVRRPPSRSSRPRSTSRGSSGRHPASEKTGAPGRGAPPVAIFAPAGPRRTPRGRCGSCRAKAGNGRNRSRSASSTLADLVLADGPLLSAPLMCSLTSCGRSRRSAWRD